VRYRHVIKNGVSYRMFFNEGMRPCVSFTARGRDGWLANVTLGAWELAVV
jgi:hypothetical protein